MADAPCQPVQVENTYSSTALMCGAAGGVLLMSVCLGVAAGLTGVMPSSQVYQIFVGGCGAWWLVVGAAAIAQLQPRPGPPLGDGGCARGLLAGAARFWGGLRTAWAHRHTFRMVVSCY